MVELGSAVAAAGLVVGAGGNIAARDGDGALCVTTTGCDLAALSPADLVHVSLDGSCLDDGRVPTSELPLHLAAFRARPDVVWSVHLHPPTATLLSALDIPIRMITTDHAFYLREIGVVPFVQPGSTQVGEAAAQRLAGVNVLLLAHHGCLVVADTPELALSRALNLEAAAVATYRARLLGDTTTACPPEFLAEVRRAEAAGYRYGPRPASGPRATGR